MIVINTNNDDFGEMYFVLVEFECLEFYHDKISDFVNGVWWI